jgi:hypothetical protein
MTCWTISAPASMPTCPSISDSFGLCRRFIGKPALASYSGRAGSLGSGAWHANLLKISIRYLRELLKLSIARYQAYTPRIERALNTTADVGARVKAASNREPV